MRGNPGQFFGPDEYPAEAIRLRQKGRVVAKLWIDTSGNVASCTVTTSSGSPALDQRTCEIALDKVTFIPAVDEHGRPIAVPYTLPVRWVLPHGPIDVTVNPPPAKWYMSMTLSVAPGGVVLACNGTVSAKLVRDAAGPCDEFPVGSTSQFRWIRDGKPVGGVVKRHSEQEITIDP